MAHPMIAQQITFLYSADLVVTAKFYESVMGLELALDQGACCIYRTGSQSFLGFCQREQVQSDHTDVIFTLVTTDVDGWFEHLKDNGLTIGKAPAVNPSFNIYHFFLRDPNGYLIEIQQFLDPDWNQEGI